MKLLVSGLEYVHTLMRVSSELILEVAHSLQINPVQRPQRVLLSISCQYKQQLCAWLPGPIESPRDGRERFVHHEGGGQRSETSRCVVQLVCEEKALVCILHDQLVVAGGTLLGDSQFARHGTLRPLVVESMPGRRWADVWRKSKEV